MSIRLLAWMTAFLIWLGAISGCSVSIGSEEMTVLAGSELKDLQPMMDDIEDATGIRLNFKYIGTLDGAERLASGEDYDLAWFSHGKYITLIQNKTGANRIVTQEKIMLSPVVLGVKKSVADQWNWTGNRDLTWGDIAEKSGSGDLVYMMTDASASNSGFSGLFGVISAFADAGEALKVADIDEAKVKKFFTGLKGRAGSSGWLAETYVKEQEKYNGIVNYESVLLSLNNSGQLREKLELIYPKEGIVTADYPLMLLEKEKREQYDRLVEYLKSEKAQAKIQELTLRRPVNRKVKLDPMFAKNLIELPFPNRLEIIDEVLFTYLDKHRPPSHAVFVLDTSGSMSGQRIDDLRKALSNLTGLDTSLAGQFARFREREKVTFIPFSNYVKDTATLNVRNTGVNDQSMQELRRRAESLQADGGTAIFDALIKAYQYAEKAQIEAKDHYVTIVLMTDGDNQSGASLGDFESFYRQLPKEAKSVRTFPILFGASNDEEMRSIAELTGGRVFDAKKQSLTRVFKSIRGYQ